MSISLKDTADITTENWGTARNIQIGNTSKSVNGSGNVSWSLSEIGAAPAGYGLGTTCQDKSNQDCNNILVTGFYMGSNMTNKPSGCTHGWIYLLVMKHNDSWVRQVAYDFLTASQVYTRVKQNGSWTAWVATDTNTWRGVQDNLTSTATDQSLSANQGKVLKGLIDGKAASNHTHSYLPLSGGTMTGSLVIPGNNSDNGLFVGQSSIQSIDRTLIMKNSTGFRFSDSNLWDYNCWAGLQYIDADRKIYLGGPKGTKFASNNSPATVDVDMTYENSGVNTVHTNNLNVQGNINLPNNSLSLYVGDDAVIGDGNIANQIVIQGRQDSSTGGITFGSGKDTNIYRGGANLLKTDDTMNAVGGFQWNGQSLDERYFARRGEIRKTTNWNSIVHPGCYKVQQDSWGNAESTHAPCQGYPYGLLMVYRTDVIGEDRLYQVYMPHRPDEPRWYRMCNNGGWDEWKAQDVRGSADRRYYHAGNKPTASEIGAAAASHTHDDRYIRGNNILLSVESDILNSSALTTSRKQLIAGSADKVYAGNTSANLILESSSTPQVKMNNNFYPIYHSGNKPTASEIGAAASNHTHNYAASNHTHNYAASPSAGGSASTVYLPRVVGASVSANYLPGANKFEFKEFANDCANTPNASWYHIFTGQGSDAGYNTQLALGMTTEAVYYRNRTVGTWGRWKQLAFTDSSISGNASTATTLQTARTINGTSFNGSGNITTANWGTARNIQIGNTAKSVNGSGNVSWTLGEIGAAASNHTHGLVNLNSEAFSGGNDLNTYNSTKTWVARTFNSTTNRPSDWYTVANFGADGNSNFQLAHSYASDSTLYVRGRHDKSGNYTPWAKIYTDKNKPTASDIGAATSSSVGTLSSLKTSAKGNLVDAINEVFQSADSARSSLVSAIGSPLTSTDTLASIATKLQSKKQELGTAAAKVVDGVSSSTNLNTIVSTLNGYKPYVGRAHTLYVDFNGGKTIYIKPQKTNGSTTMKQGSAWMAMIKDVGAKRDYCLCTNSSYGFPSKTKDANNAVTFSIDSSGEVSISCSTYTSKTYKIMLSSINATYSEIDETESSSYYYVVKTLEEKDEEEGRKDEESNC